MALPTAIVCLAVVAFGWGVSGGARDPARTTAAEASASPADESSPSPTAVPAGSVMGLYSAGFRRSDCYGSCRVGTSGYAAQQQTRARIAEVQRLGGGFVLNNESIVAWYVSAPTAVFAFLTELHSAGVRTSYSVASGPEKWFVNGQFDTSQAEALFRKTDLDHDGVSDLDGRLDALYQGHEVLEWATHEQRVQIYQVAKKWFPHTPVQVYYAAIGRPEQPGAATDPHPAGPGGYWADYAYGPGEADIVLAGIRRNGDITGVGTDSTTDPAVSEEKLAAAGRTVATIVHGRTPQAALWVVTSFAGDTAMRKKISSMWAPSEITGWYHGLASVPDISAFFLRSYARFQYDLAYSAFTAQRAAYTEAAREAAVRVPS